MAIVTLAEVLDFCDVEKGYFVITAANNVLKLAYGGGSVTDIDITDGTYEGAGLATELQSKINTAFGNSSTVSYSTDTKKFTIDVGEGNNIAYTNDGSDAGLTIGFDQDHSATQILTSDLAAGDPSSILESIQSGVEDWIANKCHRIFESDDYAEYYDGEGGKYIILNNYPITALIRICIGRRYAIRIKNTSTYTSATVSITSTGLVFTKNDVSDSTITFADNATMSEMVTAINALDGGWSAVLESSDYTNFKSSELVRMFGRNVIHNNEIYLEMPEEAIDDFEVIPNRGELYRPMGWPEGINNVFVKFTAGYSTMPERLKLGVKIACKHIYQKRKEEMFGIVNYGIGDINIHIEKGDMPKEALAILSKFRRILV